LRAVAALGQKHRQEGYEQALHAASLAQEG
jgi:hypothetical protein